MPEVTTSSCGGDASVVNDQLTSAASAFPATSVTPPAPPLSVTVYDAPYANAACGVTVAVFEAASYDTVAGTTAAVASFSWNVALVVEPAFIGSLNIAVIEAPALTPAAPGAGALAVTVGRVVSGVTLRAMSAWISAG